MFRVLFFWMCLITALTGTPLRQAEAAEDFTRALTELAGGHLVEEIDGRVGDDRGEIVLNSGIGEHSSTLALPLIPLDGLCLTAPIAVCDPRPQWRLETNPLPEPFAASSRRHAWLQCFLF